METFLRKSAGLFASGLFYILACRGGEAIFGRDVSWPMLYGFLIMAAGTKLCQIIDDYLQ